MDFIKDAVSNATKGSKDEGKKEEKKGESQDYLDKGMSKQPLYQKTAH